MSDADSPSEEHEKALALAADCAKLWPKMLAKGLEEPAADAPTEGQLNRPTELSEADTHTIKEMREQLRKMLTDLCLKEKIRYMQGLHEARLVAAVFAYIQSVAAFDSSDSQAALNCFTAFVRQQLRKTGCGAPWTGSVLARAEQERRLALLAREAVAQQVREGQLGGEAAPSSGLPTLKAPQPWRDVTEEK
eukprot:Skav222849  [mRNA]  locus=scaffold850:177914:181291:- [translate_table: standard]